MFHVNVAKVDRDVAYVAIVVHICYKLMFPVFIFFSNVCCKCVYFECCICFMLMLQVFYLDVYICFLQWFQVFLGVFASVSDACFKCFIYL
jgi:hypothetical protein